MNTLFVATIVLLVLFMCARMPIWAAIVLAGIPYLLFSGVPLSAVASTMAGGQITSFILLAFPLFSLAGRLMNTGEISKRIFDFANTNVGWIRGGLGQVNIAASMLFAGMSGSAIADISGLGAIELKGMRDKGYDIDFSIGITLASSVIGPIIPPSTPMIIYSVISGESVLRLFLGGFLPGILIGGTLMIMVYFITRNRKYPVEKRPTLIEHLKSWKAVFLSLFTTVILFSGMIGGIFTPTEAASVAVLYAIFLGMVVYKNITLKMLIEDIKDTMLFCANIYTIVAASMVLSFIFTRENIGITLVGFVMQSALPPAAVVFLLLIITLLLGCFIEVSALIILILPILIPIVTAIGFPPVAFGVIFILTSVLGILTPPFGLGLYIGAEIAGLDFKRTVKSVIPFFLPLFIVITLMVFFPRIVTLIPDVVLRK